MAQPQNTMPKPISTLVIMAGVEWNWVKVYRIMPGSEIVRIMIQIKTEYFENVESKYFEQVS